MASLLLVTPLNVPFKEYNQWRCQCEGVNGGNEYKRKLAPKFPIGNLSIASYLLRNIEHLDVNILDYNNIALRYDGDCNSGLCHFLEYGLDLMSSERGWGDLYEVDVIGISLIFGSNYYDFSGLLGFFASRFPGAILVTGGHLASAINKELLSENIELDAVCYGEGELPMRALMSGVVNCDAWNVLAKNDSWITREKITDSKFIPDNKHVECLDAIPPYVLDVALYFEDYFGANIDGFTLGQTHSTEKDLRDIEMFSSRGCPYRCIFCASSVVHGKNVRRLSYDRVVGDIEYYHEKYGVNSFAFLDDHFLGDREYAKKIIKYVMGRGFGFRAFNLNYNHVDAELALLISDAGVDRVLITVDGVNEGFLRRVVKKPASFKKAKEVISMFRGLDVVVVSNIIIGFPGETKASIADGVHDVWALGANWYSVLTAIPLQGTELYDYCADNGLIPKNDSVYSVDYHSSVISTAEFTTEWLAEKAYEINLYLNFVNNYDMSNGCYYIPLQLYERLLSTVVEDHAFAYYYAAICAKELGDREKYSRYRGSYNSVVRASSFWAKWADHFSLSQP